jgi:transcriptional regulator with XRE-family HTH domain
MTLLTRKTHLLGTKLKALRKSNGLTLEDLSTRCIQENPDVAPSVSYLSMLESGKRVPSKHLLDLLAKVFQRTPAWFMDDNAEVETRAPAERRRAVAHLPMEPAFLFSKRLLEAAIPELLSQTGTSGRQFAHLLIRSHQELSHNDFPDLERAAEAVGERRFPLNVDDLLRLGKRHGLEFRWFERKPVRARDQDREIRSLLRSFVEPGNVVYLNEALQKDPARLKFDIASYIGHKVLHGGDGLRSPHATGGEMGGSPEGLQAGGLDPQEVLYAWRDFECSFFAGALLCPKAPFRRFLARERYRVTSGKKLDLTPAVIMRRMTKVSPYPHWHFFDAYPPGYLRAVYRGNGIPLPWGNLNRMTDPCPHWAVFRLIEDTRTQSSSQISVLRDGERSLLYCCHSLRTRDMAGNPHVLSVGIDLLPALQSNGHDAPQIVQLIAQECQRRGGRARLPKETLEAIRSVANVLNIAWVEEALEQPASIICPRSTSCPRSERCEGIPAVRAREITDLKTEIVDAGAWRDA